MAIRKASMVALRVFGSLLGVEMQVHVGSALVVAFLMSHLAAEPCKLSLANPSLPCPCAL